MNSVVAFDNKVNFDQNIAFNLLHFQKYSSDDKKLMIDILVYFAKERQNNLFGFGKLDPVHFSKTMGISLKHKIWVKHENPKQFESVPGRNITEKRAYLEENNIPVFDNYLENALFCLLSDVFMNSGSETYLHKPGKFIKRDFIKSVQFITDLEKIEERYVKTNKTYYLYTLSNVFLDNLSFLFFKLDLLSLKACRKKNYEPLYMVLRYKLDSMYLTKNRVCEFHFNNIKSLLDINSERPSYIKQKISKAFDFVINQPDLKGKCHYKWFQRPGDRFHYGINFYCDMAFDKIEDESVQRWNESEQNYLKQLLFQAFLRRYPELRSEDLNVFKNHYIKWLKNSEVDSETKEAAYLDCSKIFNKNDKFYKSHCKIWLANLHKEYANYI